MSLLAINLVKDKISSLHKITQCFYITGTPSFLGSNTEKKKKTKQWTLCQRGGHKSSFTISAFPFPRVIFDGQHYLFCHTGAVLRADKCIFMVLQGW